MDAARYPVELIDVVFLANGERVLVRPVLPQDAAVQAPFFSALSEQSRYNRFLNPMRSFPPGLIERFSRVDHRSHVALIAETVADGVETVIGEARYVVDAEDQSAEFAIAIADAFQGAGLGTLLLNRLVCIAGHAGLKRLTGETLATNEAMIALARKAGFDVAYDPELMHLKRLTRDLTAVQAPYPCYQARAREARVAA
jgi:acetyltransferase